MPLPHVRDSHRPQQATLGVFAAAGPPVVPLARLLVVVAAVVVVCVVCVSSLSSSGSDMMPER